MSAPLFSARDFCGLDPVPCSVMRRNQQRYHGADGAGALQGFGRQKAHPVPATMIGGDFEGWVRGLEFGAFCILYPYSPLGSLPPTTAAE